MATFQDEASFSQATFGRGTWFEGVIFGGAASFDATFQGGTWLGGAVIGDDAWFADATFQDDALFGEAHVLHFDDLDLDRWWPDGWTVRPDPTDPRPARWSLRGRERAQAGGPPVRPHRYAVTDRGGVAR